MKVTIKDFIEAGAHKVNGISHWWNSHTMNYLLGAEIEVHDEPNEDGRYYTEENGFYFIADWFVPITKEIPQGTHSYYAGIAALRDEHIATNHIDGEDIESWWQLLNEVRTLDEVRTEEIDLKKVDTYYNCLNENVAFHTEKQIIKKLKFIIDEIKKYVRPVSLHDRQDIINKDFMSNAAKEPVISGTGWAKPEMVIPASQINKTAKELQEELNKGGIIEIKDPIINAAIASRNLAAAMKKLREDTRNLEELTFEELMEETETAPVYFPIQPHITQFINDGLITATNANIILSHLNEVGEPISTKKIELFIHDGLLTRENAGRILNRLVIHEK